MGETCVICYLEDFIPEFKSEPSGILVKDIHIMD
jgi:hypothetical protein